MNYTKVQFISWELNTGPVVTSTIPLPPPLGNQLQGYYPGYIANAFPDKRVDILSQVMDIHARVAFTGDAIAKAYTKADTASDTLKVFMAPEFLYRGAGGAYVHDLLNGWAGASPAELGLPPAYDKWSGLFGSLQQLVANDHYNDWVFVFGTAISASFGTYKAVDGKYYINVSEPAEYYNTALIQLGGSKNTQVNYASRKHYVSGIDFLNYSTYYYQHIMSSGAPIDPANVVPADTFGVPEGGAVFHLANVNDSTGKPLDFGIEICLDHDWSAGVPAANNFGRLRTANQNVKIQLVPSAGMNLKDSSIRLLPVAGPTPNSYAFNCDGLSNLAPRTAGSHTQIWNGSNGAVVPAGNKLYEASNGQALNNTVVTAVTHSVPNGNAQLNDTVLWQQGAGNVRVMKSLPL